VKGSYIQGLLVKGSYVMQGLLRDKIGDSWRQGCTWSGSLMPKVVCHNKRLPYFNVSSRCVRKLNCRGKTHLINASPRA